MKNRLIVGFSGKRGAGKTQAALHLSKYHGFKIVSFGNSLREMAKTFFPFTPVDFSEKNKESPYKLYDWTPRDFMIALGKFARFHDEDYWVKAAKIESIDGNIAIDDVRFPNEVEYLKGLGGRLVRLERFEKLNIYGKNLDDPTETSLDNYDGFDRRVEACWNTTLPELRKQVDSYMKELKNAKDNFGA